MKLFLKFHCKQSHTSLVVFFQSQCLAYQVQIQTQRLRTPHPPDCRAPCSCSNKKRRWAAVTVKGRQVGLRREREAELWMTPPGSIPRFSSEMQRDCWCQSTDVLYIIKRWHGILFWCCLCYEKTMSISYLVVKIVICMKIAFLLLWYVAVIC